MLPALTACSGTGIYNKSLKDVNQILDDSALQMKKSRNISLLKIQILSIEIKVYISVIKKYRLFMATLYQEGLNLQMV